MKTPDKTEFKTPAVRQGAGKEKEPSAKAADLRLRAESRLPKRRKAEDAGKALKSDADTLRLLHELQVHQIELEMQNLELQESRDQSETLLDKYVELYDFAPVGYFSLDERGRILRVNLTGASLLGVERSRLISRSFLRFAEPALRSGLLELLAQVFAGSTKQIADIRLQKRDGTNFWAGLHGCPATISNSGKKVCRLVVSDITVRKEAEEARHHLEILKHSNDELMQEIVRRQAVEEALRKSDLHQIELLEQARSLQQKLRMLSHSNMHAVERERRRISRDLHDDVVQSLVGINFHLASLAGIPAIPPDALKQKIADTQHVVEASVRSILNYALALRPPSLDDLGLIVSLNTLVNEFRKRTEIRVDFKACAELDPLSSDQRIALYRIVQTALANVEEHSQATRVELLISKTDDVVHLKITDNGISFNVQGTTALLSGKHLGLISMRERAEMMGGEFQIESVSGKGTTLHVQIPIAFESDGPDPSDK